MKEICQLLDIDKLRTTFYKASTNAAIERFHRTLNSMLGKVIDEQQNDWDLWLPYVMAAYRSSRHNTTNYSPNFLMLGREVRAPIDIVLGTGEPTADNMNYDDFVENTRNRMQTAYELVRCFLGEAALRNKRYYDVRVRPAKYKVGQWVYYYNPRRYKNRQDKWARKYTGPFCVIRVLGPVNVELRQTKYSKPFIVHIDKIKPYLGTPPKGWLSVDNNSEVSELFTQNEIHDSVSDLVEEVDETTQPPPNMNPDVADVITFSTDQKFRRDRPRRQACKPARYRS
jgi:hypothetical protein